MRISSGMVFDLGVSSINRQTASLLHLQQQVSEGKRVLSPSDDPVAAARALEVTQSKSVIEQFAVNHNNATSALGLEEAQLSSSSDVLARVRELAVQAGNSFLSTSDRRALAFELRARFDELIGISNATDGTGQYIFSGYMGSVKPFGGTVDELNSSANDISYDGDDGQRRLQISPTRFLEVSDSGQDVFGRIRNGNGYFTTDYSTNNVGTGMIDAGNVLQPALWNSVPAAEKENVEIRFWRESGVIGSITPGFVTGLADDQFTISVAGSNPVTVTVPPGPFDLTQTQDAVNKALGVAPPNLGSAIVSLDGSNQLMIQSPTNQAIVLGSANGNTGLGNLFGTPGTGSGATFYDIVDVTSSQSLLTNSLAATPTFSQPFPSTPAGMRRFSPGQPINLSGLAGPTANYGVSVTISGDPANGDAFKVKPSSSQSVFKTVANLIETLERTASGDPATSAQYSNDIGFALTNLDQATENILRVRAAIGSRMGEIDSLSSVNEDLTLQYQQTLSQLQDLDYAKAITDLTRKQTDLQAAQQSFIRTSQLSLFNYL